MELQITYNTETSDRLEEAGTRSHSTRNQELWGTTLLVYRLIIFLKALEFMICTKDMQSLLLGTKCIIKDLLHV